MTELDVLRWIENPNEPEEDETQCCKWCHKPEGECTCIDDWKLIG